jgi:hypothetical protein
MKKYTNIIQFLVAKALLFNAKSYISFLMLSAIIFLVSSVMLCDTLNIHSIGSELSIYSGLSQIQPLITIMKNSQKLNKSYIVNWSNKVYTFDNIIFSIDLLKKYINKFWKDNIIQLDKDSHILILTRLKRENGQIETIGNLKILNIDDKDYLFEHLVDIMNLKIDVYENVPINSIIFSYGVKTGLAPKKGVYTDIKYQNYYHFRLPITMDPLKYGKLLFKNDNTYFIQINDKNIAIIEMKDIMNEVKLFKAGDLIYEWIDKYIDESTFIREIGQKKFTFVNEELKLLRVDKTSNFIKKAKKF